MAFSAPIERLGSWQAFVRAAGLRQGHWVFRGALEAWNPETSLERACKSWDVPLSSAREVERRLVREFQRHPEAAREVLESTDYLGWFALMQHYGAPTRLLDWTYSPFVAAYFAFDALLAADPAGSGGLQEAAVWAINTDWLVERVRSVLDGDQLARWEAYRSRRDGASFSALFVEASPAPVFISTANPMRLNERLSIQQGLFLCSGDVSRSWADNFAALGPASEPMQARSFVMDRTVMREAFEELHRMNVSARSLFPGLGGYATSMRQRLRLLLDIPLAS